MIHTIELGGITIQQIVEQQGALFEALTLFPTLTKELLDENRSWLEPSYLDPTGKLVLCIQSYVVRTAHHTILVDTCCGNHKDRFLPEVNQLDTDYLGNLRRAGFAPEDIDLVMCTHLHFDHVGWNTKLENGAWVPSKSLDVMAWDSGGDDGTTYLADDVDTNPKKPTSLNRSPHFLKGGNPMPVAHITFTRM